MRLKSFTAKTAAEAMAEVRRTLGGDAVIVATREEEGMVRVTAAIDSNPQTAQQQSFSIRAEKPIDAYADEEDVVENIAQSLNHHGLPRDLIDKLTDDIQGYDLSDPISALSAVFDATFTFAPLPQGQCERPLMLIGPPGAGKTLTVAKLATRMAMAQHPLSVITMDTERAGGIEQLAAFTRLLNVDLIEVEDTHALQDALTVRRNVRQILIDTPGQNPFDPQALGQLGRLIKTVNAEAICVLPAGMDAQESGEMASAFHAAGATRLLMTRLDIARRLGGLLSAAWQGRLSFCDAARSSSVTTPLLQINSFELARLLLPESESKVNSERQTGTKL